MKEIKFNDETIWMNGEVIGIYSWRDENSRFMPSKRKVFWAVVFEHESQSDDFIWWAFSIPELKSRVRKYLENKEKGVKDLPQISEQIERIFADAWEFTGEKYGYYTKTQNEEFLKLTSRLHLPEELKKRGYSISHNFSGYQLVPTEIYNIL